MCIERYQQLRKKGFRASIVLEIAKLKERKPVCPKEEFFFMPSKEYRSSAASAVRA